MTYVLELRTDKLNQLYLWEPEAYKDKVNSLTLYHGIVIGIAGLLALFLTILFVVKGTAMFPATADKTPCRYFAASNLFANFRCAMSM